MFSPSRHTVHTIGDLHDCVILLRRPESLSKYFVIQIFLLSWEKTEVTAYELEGPSGRRLSPVSVAWSD